MGFNISVQDICDFVYFHYRKTYPIIWNISLLPSQNGIYSFQNSYIVYYLIKSIMWTMPNINVCIIYPWKKFEINCIT
jgi:hypothetical protein